MGPDLLSKEDVVGILKISKRTDPDRWYEGRFLKNTVFQ
jgi:hypothetical protein